MTEKIYKVHYSFEGEGEVEVKAHNKAEAEEKFDDGDWWYDESEGGRKYVVEDIEEMAEEHEGNVIKRVLRERIDYEEAEDNETKFDRDPEDM